MLEARLGVLGGDRRAQLPAGGDGAVPTYRVSSCEGRTAQVFVEEEAK